MGWWSATILGGDAPLDYLDKMASALGVNNENGPQSLYNYEFTAELLNKKTNISKLLKTIKAGYSDQSIGYQVLGVILMTTGSNIPKELKKIIINQSLQDEWFNTKDQERGFFIIDFIHKLEYYDGKPIFVATERLFQKLHENRTSGKSGLINKNMVKKKSLGQ